VKKIITWGLVIAAGIGLVVLLAVRVMAARAARVEEAPADVPAAPVSVAAAAKRDLAERVLLTGVIRPAVEVDVIAKVPGRIESIAVNVGDKVKAGTLLAVIEHRTLELQAAQAAAATNAATAALESARVGLSTANTSYERMKGLFAEKAIPLAEFEKVEAGVRAAESGVKAAEAQLEMAKAAAGLAGEALRNSRVVSPIAGTVTKRLVDVGVDAAPGRALFQLQDVSALELDGAVTAEDFARLAKDAPVRVTVDDIRGAVFTGHVATLSPTLDPGTRRASIEIAVDNPEGRLLPNMFASAAIDVGLLRGALCIPTAAIVSLPSGAVVFVVKKDKAVMVKPVLGAGDGEWTAVESGLEEGDRVIVTGHAGLADGAKVIASDARLPAATPESKTSPESAPAPAPKPKPESAPAKKESAKATTTDTTSTTPAVVR